VARTRMMALDRGVEPLCWRGIGLGVALLCVISALTGCRDRPRDAPGGLVATTTAAPVVSREIREVDFSNLEWFDSPTASTVTLINGMARRDADNESSGYSWRLSGSPQYADADGDGHEDAAVGLSVEGAQLTAETWYVWLWRNGEAVQLQLPIAGSSRCTRPVESVAAVPEGFRVETFIAVSEDSCAGGGSVPVTYVVGVRDGWPVRISPYFGPIASCDPRSLTVALRPKREVLLYTATDIRSPAVEPAANYDEFLVDEYSADGGLTPEREWILGIAVSGARRVCGWARADQVRTPQ
jgi:hypothetical protein